MAVLTKGLYNCSCSRETCDWSCTTYATMMSDKVPNTAIGYIPPLKKTNADKIRGMTDEELADFLDTVNMASCSFAMGKSPCKFESTECPCWLSWLKEEEGESR